MNDRRKNMLLLE